MRKSPSAFSLVEFVAAGAIIIILILVGLAGYANAVRASRAASCLSNLRQLGVAALAYAADNDGRLPQSSHQGPRLSWTTVLKRYLPSDILKSPLDDTPRAWSYAINDFLTERPFGARSVNFSRLQSIESPTLTMMMAVLNPSQQNTDHFHFADPRVGQSTASFRAEVWVDLLNGASNYLFVDGHVARIRWDDIQQLLERPDSKFIRPDGNNLDLSTTK